MAQQIQSSKVENLLSGPSPEITVTKIDFTQKSLPEYKDCYAVILENVLTSDECSALISAADETNGPWERAMVNIGGGKQALYTDTRNCGRIIWDSVDLTEKIWKRCEPHLQDIIELENRPHVTGIGPVKRKEVWDKPRLNERMRFLKYVGGEYFKPHADGAYETPDGSERSYFTLHLYLNDNTNISDSTSNPSPDDKPLKGGATTFHSYNMRKRLDVEPKAGRVLVFQHRNLVHSGDDVLEGTKFTMRTDIMYRNPRKSGGN